MVALFLFRWFLFVVFVYFLTRESVGNTENKIDIRP